MTDIVEPGTPLPWREAGGDAILAGRDAEMRVVGSITRESDVHYAVEACNAYPTLRQQVADRDAKLREAREAFLETREFLGMLEQVVCDWSCPSKWKTDEGQPHSQLHEDLKAVLAKHEAIRTTLANLGGTDAG